MTLIERWRHAPIRNQDGDGHLSEAGYEWDEARLGAHVALGALALGFSVVGLATVFNGAALVAGAMLPMGVISFATLLYRLERPRMVLFMRDGRILTPHGVARWFGVRKLGFPHWEIASIELTSDCKDFGVVLYSTEGRTILLAERMYKADARQVAVQLTKALREMRESLATVASRRQASLEAHATEMRVH